MINYALGIRWCRFSHAMRGPFIGWLRAYCKCRHDLNLGGGSRLISQSENLPILQCAFLSWGKTSPQQKVLELNASVILFFFGIVMMVKSARVGFPAPHPPPPTMGPGAVLQKKQRLSMGTEPLWQAAILKVQTANPELELDQVTGSSCQSSCHLCGPSVTSSYFRYKVNMGSVSIFGGQTVRLIIATPVKIIFSLCVNFI